MKYQINEIHILDKNLKESGHVYVICPGCNHGHELYHNDWSAIICQNCKSELHKLNDQKDQIIKKYNGFSNLELLSLKMGMDRRLEKMQMYKETTKETYQIIINDRNEINNVLKYRSE